MTKRVQAKNKICRRLGVNLWGRAKNPIVKRDYPPGEHGSKRRKASDYGQQLAAKQKLKGYYGNITERQFQRLYQQASRRRGDTAETDRAARTPPRHGRVPAELRADHFAARQFVNHGHVMVNGRRVTIPSYLVREGDTIEVRDKSKNLTMVLERSSSPNATCPTISRSITRAQGHLRARAQARRRAVSGADGAESGRRVLFALSRRPAGALGPPRHHRRCGSPIVQQSRGSIIPGWPQVRRARNGVTRLWGARGAMRRP